MSAAGAELLTSGAIMKPWLRIFLTLGVWWAAVLPATLRAQLEPILEVDIFAVAVASGSGAVVSIRVVNGGNGYSEGLPPVVALSGGGGTGASAVAVVSNGAVSSIAIVSGGTGYTSAPTVSVAPPGTVATATATAGSGPAGALTTGNLTLVSGGTGYDGAPAVILTGGGGSGAAVTATVSNGSVVSLTVTSGGTGYTSAPTVTLGSPGTTAVAAATGLGTFFRLPFQNESSGPVKTPVTFFALARGTFPLAGFTYKYYVNGVPLSESSVTQPPGGGYGAVSWAPPQPGAYFIKVEASDGAHIAFSTIRYFATGTDISSPIDNTLVPRGSSIVVQATATPPPSAPTAFVQRVEFYADGVLVNTDVTFPYSFIYTPSDLPGTHVLEARAFDNQGAQISPNGTTTRRVYLVTPIGAPPTVRVLNPQNGTSVNAGSTVSLIAEAAAPNGFIRNVDFYLNGVLLGTTYNFPHTFNWTPLVVGSYQVIAIGFDDKSNAVASTPVMVSVTGGFPSASIVSPGTAGVTITQGAVLPVTVRAAGADGGLTSLRKIEFLVDGAVNDSLPKTVVGSDEIPVLTEPFVFNWKSNVTIGVHRISARVTDINNLSVTSSELTVNVVPNQAPQIAITTPTATTALAFNTGATFAVTASDTDGTIDRVEFFANGASIGVATKSPFQINWTPTSSGPVSLTARATDNGGATTTSTMVNVTVSPGQPPVVTLTSPRNGSVARVGSASNLTATATDTDGSVVSVQFFANGIPVAAPDTSAPYSVQWTPPAEGIYRISATALDTSGGSSTITSTVMAVSGNGGADIVYTGSYAGVGENGRFAVISVRGKTAAFIGFSTSGSSQIYHFPSLPVDAAGGFSATDGSGRTLVSGAANETGVSGTLDGGRLTFIGPMTFASSVNAVAAGYYTGNFSGKPTSTFAAIIGPDGSLMLYAEDGAGFRDAGAGTVSSTGAFSVTTLAGNRFTGIANPATGFLSGGLAGGPGGAFTAALASGVSFSDGLLSNLSTRGQVGTGANILIAGFVVGGNAPKRILIRAIGPGLVPFGVTGLLADPQLQLMNGAGTAVLASNDNWGTPVGAGAATASALTTAFGETGAFPLTTGSLDAAVVMTLAPGQYSAQVSGVAGGAGVALVELYDLDSLAPFAVQKVMNVSTRGVVGTGQAQLIAGFMVSGNAPKKVLIRAVGPTLGSVFNVPGALVDPVLRLVRSDSLVIRENDNWELGNDRGLISDAAARVGAFSLASGSRDAAMIVSLPPGIYSAQVTGSGTSTGVALVEVYEVP